MGYSASAQAPMTTGRLGRSADGIGRFFVAWSTVSTKLWFSSWPPDIPKSCFVCSQSRRSASLTLSQALMLSRLYQSGWDVVGVGADAIGNGIVFMNTYSGAAMDDAGDSAELSDHPQMTCEIEQYGDDQQDRERR